MRQVVSMAPKGKKHGFGAAKLIVGFGEPIMQEQTGAAQSLVPHAPRHHGFRGDDSQRGRRRAPSGPALGCLRSQPPGRALRMPVSVFAEMGVRNSPGFEGYTMATVCAESSAHTAPPTTDGLATLRLQAWLDGVAGRPRCRRSDCRRARRHRCDASVPSAATRRSSTGHVFCQTRSWSRVHWLYTQLPAASQRFLLAGGSAHQRRHPLQHTSAAHEREA
jgi:hypothetical protein